MSMDGWRPSMWYDDVEHFPCFLIQLFPSVTLRNSANRYKIVVCVCVCACHADWPCLYFSDVIVPWFTRVLVDRVLALDARKFAGSVVWVCGWRIRVVSVTCNVCTAIERVDLWAESKRFMFAGELVWWGHTNANDWNWWYGEMLADDFWLLCLMNDDDWRPKIAFLARVWVNEILAHFPVLDYARTRAKIAALRIELSFLSVANGITSPNLVRFI